MRLLPKLILSCLGLLILASQACRSPAATAEEKLSEKTVHPIQQKAKASDEPVIEENPDDYANYYVLMVDTGQQYAPLREGMERLSSAAGLKIDTLNRSYRLDKDLIALPENDEDEMYAGDYFPRRSPGDFLSIEYLNFYDERAKEKMMVLIAGIYDEKNLADSALSVIRKSGHSAVSRKIKMFVGCLH